MHINRVCQLAAAGWLVALTGFIQPGWAQSKSAPGDKPASNLAIIHEKLKADKKLIVAKYMELTESEAKKFWPVFRSEDNSVRKPTSVCCVCSKVTLRITGTNL